VKKANQNLEVLAVIPARGGSKAIPRKNIVDLCGKPLIAYTIEVALMSRLITRVVVSTDDQEIADLSRELGAEVPFLRPSHLADDKADIGKAISYTTERLREEGYVADVQVQLYPTHPFRTPQLLDRLTAILIDGYQQVLTVKPVNLANTHLVYKVAKGRIASLSLSLDSGFSNTLFRPYGLYYGARCRGLRPVNTYLHPLTDPISLIDIDYWEDLCFAEEVIRNNLFVFNSK
jgi:CTP:molybdopterin cytidylyltransferase MocA